MNFRRRIRILESRKTPSTQMMKRTYNRALLNGGVVQDFTANVENIRSLSRTLGYDNVDRGKTEYRRNLINYSDFNNVIWVKSLSNLSGNQIANPVDNSIDSSLLSQNGSPTSTNGRRLSYTIPSYNGVYTFSIFAKKLDFDAIGLNMIASSTLQVTINIVDGSLISSVGVVTSTITNCTNGWYRISISGNVSNLTRLDIVLCDNTGNFIFNDTNTFGNYIFGAQLELGAKATDYQATTTSVVTTYLEPASFTYVPTSYGEGRNFVEVHNKRNLISWSEDLTNSIWVKNSLTVTSNIIKSPDGFITADKIVESSGSSSYKRIYQLTTASSTPNGFHTFSMYIKKGERFMIGLSMSDGVTGDVGCTFNLNTISCIPAYTNGSWTLLGSKISDAGDGWFKCSVSGYRNSGTRSDIFIYMLDNTGNSNYTGNGTSGIYIWGAQLEQSNGVGMYLPKTNVVLNNNVDFNFTRATSATLVNKQGFIEDSCYNLLSNSDVYTGSNWTKESMTATANAAIAPNGTFTATKISSSSVGNYCRLYPSTTNIYINNTYTNSFYVKAAELNFIHVRASFGSSTFGFCVNLTNAIITPGKYDGTLSSTFPTIYSAKLMPGGWIYVSYTVNVTASVSNFYIHISDSASSTSNSVIGRGVYFGGTQFSLGTLQRAYLKTTNRLNVPRLDYNRGLYKPSLLIERAGTNLFLQSEDISTSWSNDCAVVKTLNVTTSPDGRVAADKLAEFNGSGAHNSYRGYSATAGIKYTISGYFKPAGRNNAVLSFNNSPITNSVRVNFNLTTGLVNTPIIIGSASYVNSKMTLVQQGFYRCEFTAIAPVSATYYSGISIGINDSDDGSVRVGDGVSGLYVWGMQLEVNSLATTYIPTTTTTVTRNDETNYVDLWNNAMLNKNNWTLFWEGYLYDGSGSNISFALSDTTTANSDTNQIGWDSYLRPFYNISNTRTNSTNGATNSTVNKYVIQYNNGVVNFYINGINTWSNQSVPVFDYRYLVLNSGGSTYATDKICLWPRTLTNNESIKLSKRITPISDQPWYISSDMKFYLKFNNNLNDQTGVYSDGVGNNILYNSGLSNNLGLDSAIFNGTSSYIQMPDTAFYADTQTVSFWAKSNSLNSVFYTLGSDINGGGWGLVVGHTLSASSVGLVTASPIANNNYTGPDIKSMNEWFHMALVYDNTLDVSRTYVNGILIASKSLGVSNLLRGSSKVAIGRNAAGTPSGYTNGEIADFAVIKRVLTVSEIQSLQKPI
jgi:hypothetical protein